MFDSSYPSGQRYYWTSLFLDELPDAALDAAIERATAAPGPASVVALWQLGGAISRTDSPGGSYRQRDASHLLGIEANMLPADPSARDEHVHWARQCTEAFAPWASGGGYLNLTGAGALRGPDDPRDDVDVLRRRYDASGLFRR